MTTTASGWQYVVLKAASAKCVEQGKSPIDIPLFTDMASQIIAVQAGQVEGSAMTLAGGRLLEKQTTDLEATGAVPGGDSPNGIVVQKSAEGTAIAKAFVIAIDALIKDGTYAGLLHKHDVPESGINKSAFVSNQQELDVLNTAGMK
ncbi:hypothetical protein [Rhodococcus koreensis]|uniref:hypothetical protein n=1 Tax=Rhodococcus koreensis TaxID=99653 RepID=UPI0036730DFD